MEYQADQAIVKNAVGQEENKSDTAMVVAEIISGGISFSCVDGKCKFKTPKCEGWAREKVAWQLLLDHYENNHKKCEEEVEKTETSCEIWLPETLELDPHSDNGEAFLFWLTRFNYYLYECNISKLEEKFSKLKSRLAYEIFQHVPDAGSFETLIDALKGLYIRKRNIFAARNHLISCRQIAGESVRAYLLRLNQHTKLCNFNRPETIERNREEWVVQTESAIYWASILSVSSTPLIQTSKASAHENDEDKFKDGHEFFINKLTPSCQPESFPNINVHDLSTNTVCSSWELLENQPSTNKNNFSTIGAGPSRKFVTHSPGDFSKPSYQGAAAMDKDERPCTQQHATAPMFSVFLHFAGSNHHSSLGMTKLRPNNHEKKRTYYFRKGCKFNAKDCLA